MRTPEREAIHTMARLYSDPTQNPALAAALTAAGQNGTIVTPPQQDFDTPAMEGSMQQFLSENLGQYVVIEFLIGTQAVTTKSGILYAVGTSVVTLYQELSQTFVTCDIFSIKFVTFYLPGHRPWQVNNPLFGQGGMGPSTSIPELSAPGTASAPGFAPGVDMSAGDMGIGGGNAFPGAAPGFAPPIDRSGTAWG